MRRSDPVLAGIIERVGPCCIEYRKPDFTALARAIVYQQLNGTAAGSIYRRVAALVAGGSRRTTTLRPEAVLQAPPRRLRAAGLSAAKVKYLRDLAQKTVSGAVRFRGLPAMSDEEVIAELTQVHGIGVWSAHMFLIFALRRPDVLAVGDYGVRSAVKKAYGLERLPAPLELERIAGPWRPHASTACWYLWQSLKA
ncbi:MAG TPA: DNA-3-methyladenine glycosylase 2 family protein [Bryobacterales bacterium]|nr:DNA-3-methyladenine glycosylase 2 family protein [Bryobacterales bacterium]